MTLKSALTGALAPLLLAGPIAGPAAGPAWAELRAPIFGALPILPARFAPRLLAPGRPPPRSFTAGLQLGSLDMPIPGSRAALPARFVVPITPRTLMQTAAGLQRIALISQINVSPIDPARVRALVPSPALWRNPAPLAWHAPLLDRRLSDADKALPLAGELIEAVARIEPMFDPTRLDGPDTVKPMVVSAGTASMDSVFADRWHRASRDPNINAKVDAIALVWQPPRPFACDDLAKVRPHRAGEPALTGLNAAECQATQVRTRGADEPSAPIAVAQASVPIFAAPPPGSRLSSDDFWAKRRERIAAVEAQLRERRAQELMKVALGQM